MRQIGIVNNESLSDKVTIHNGETASTSFLFEGATDLTFKWPVNYGASGNSLTTDGTGNLIWATASGGGTINGTGSANRVAVWKGTKDLGTGSFVDNSSGVSINETSSAKAFDINYGSSQLYMSNASGIGLSTDATAEINLNSANIKMPAINYSAGDFLTIDFQGYISGTSSPGSSGTSGTSGSSGSSGASGSSGTSGANGSSGTSGANGSSGTSGLNGGTVTISGQTNYIPKYTSATVLGTSSFIETNSQLLMPNGLVGTPSIAFANDTDTGIYRSAANDLGLVAGGVDIIRLVSGSAYFRSGSLSAPSMTFLNDGDTGFYRIAENEIGIVNGGTLSVRVSSNSIYFPGITNSVLSTDANGRIVATSSSIGGSSGSSGSSGTSGTSGANGSSGTSGTSGGGSSNITTIKKTNTDTTKNTSFVTGLSFSLATNTQYYFEAAFSYLLTKDTAGGNTGILIGFSYSMAGTYSWIQQEYVDAAAAAFYAGTQSNSFPNTGGSALPYGFAFVRGLMQPATTGIVYPIFKHTNSGFTASVLPGSFINIQTL